MEILEWVPLIALAVGALIAVSGIAVTLVLRRGAWTAGALATSAAVLLVVWVVSTYQGGIRADETGTGGSVFSEAGWLAAAVVAASLSAAWAARASRGGCRDRAAQLS